MGQGEAPGRGSGAKVSWSEAPLEPSLSFRDRLAMSGGENTGSKCECCPAGSSFVCLKLNYNKKPVSCLPTHSSHSH